MQLFQELLDCTCGAQKVGASHSKNVIFAYTCDWGRVRSKMFRGGFVWNWRYSNALRYAIWKVKLDVIILNVCVRSIMDMPCTSALAQDFRSSHIGWTWNEIVKKTYRPARMIRRQRLWPETSSIICRNSTDHVHWNFFRNDGACVQKFNRSLAFRSGGAPWGC